MSFLARKTFSCSNPQTGFDLSVQGRLTEALALPATGRQLRRAAARRLRKEQKIADKQRYCPLELLSQLNTVDIHNCS